MNLKKILQSAAILLIVSFNSSYACGRFEYLALLNDEAKKDFAEREAKGLTKDSAFMKIAEQGTAYAKKLSALTSNCLNSVKDDELRQDLIKLKKAFDDTAETGDKLSKATADNVANSLSAAIDIFSGKGNAEEAVVNALTAGVDSHQLSKSFEEKLQIWNETMGDFWKKSWSLLTEDERNELQKMMQQQ